MMIYLTVATQVNYSTDLNRSKDWAFKVLGSPHFTDQLTDKRMSIPKIYCINSVVINV